METSLYLQVKSFFEQAGYVVKGKVAGCDLVGLSNDDPPVGVLEFAVTTVVFEISRRPKLI